MTAAEQALLDGIVANTALDVDAHGFVSFRANEAAATQAAASSAVLSLDKAAALEKAETKLADVESHAMTAGERYTFKFDSDAGYVVERAAAQGKDPDGILDMTGI